MRVSCVVLAVALIVTGFAGATLPVSAEVETQAAPVGMWLAQYWNGIDLSGAPVVQRLESNLNYNWGAGSPDGAVQSDFFSARWSGSFDMAAGVYRLRTRSDDGVRVWLDGRLVIDDWNLHPVTERIAEVTLAAGLHTFEVEFFEYQGDAVISFSWEPVPAPGPAGVSISPVSGPAGSIVQVHGWGFWRYANVSVSIAPVGGSPIHTHQVIANEEGKFWTTVTMPGSAAPGSQWVVIAQADSRQATSPAFRVTDGAPVSPCGTQYVVRPGDWLYQIARLCQVSVTDLLRANPQITNPSLLFPGQVLNIPAVGTPPPLPTVMATPRYNLNFRPVPTTASTPMGVIPAWTTVQVFARGPAGWIYVRYGSRYGWIAGWLCNISGNLNALPYRSS